MLMRTPHLGPRYAAFDVPLHFSKLDMKAYLKDVYNVDVLHIRSVVIQSKVQRKDPTSPYTQGALYRPPSQKKMTVQLAKPFVYPEEIKDLDPYVISHTCPNCSIGLLLTMFQMGIRQLLESDEGLRGRTTTELGLGQHPTEQAASEVHCSTSPATAQRKGQVGTNMAGIRGRHAGHGRFSNAAP